MIWNISKNAEESSLEVLPHTVSVGQEELNSYILMTRRTGAGVNTEMEGLAECAIKTFI